MCLFKQMPSKCYKYYKENVRDRLCLIQDVQPDLIIDTLKNFLGTVICLG